MKKSKRNSFKLNPIAASIVFAMASQLPVNMAYAGSGFGNGTSIVSGPFNPPTYYANSPSGPVPAWLSGTTSTSATTGLINQVDSGKALRKFVDTLPGIGSANANNLGQYIPQAVPEKWVDLNGKTTADDYYEIAAVEFTEKMHSDLPKATHLRGYVQLETAGNAATSRHIALSYPNGTLVTDPSKVTLTNTTGQVYAYDNPHHLGPIITATKGTAVRVKFSNYLPVGSAGNLFLPVDTTITGAGAGSAVVVDANGIPVLDASGKPTPINYTQNRAEIHLVGGQAPWISAGSPHQWVAPVGETTPYPQGASQQNVPDMATPAAGSATLYFPNDMSARFTFFEDRSSGITRLNTYSGLEAAYKVTDSVEQALVTAGTIPSAEIPLIIEDKTFVPANVAQQDALWDTTNWGKPGDLWFPHVYEPNQDPTETNGVNPVGRWDYGPNFWPIFERTQSAPTGVAGSTGNVSFVPESYEDTPVINGTAYPTLTVDPKAYRFRILNASNDRFLNLGLYKAAPDFIDTVTKLPTATPSATTVPIAPQLDQNGNPIVNAAGVVQYFSGTEVNMVPAVADVTGAPLTPTSGALATGATTGYYPNYDPTSLSQYPDLPQLQPTITFSGPTRAWPIDGRAGGAPDPTMVGPDFIEIGNDGGLLPGPVDIPSQPITYESNRRSVTVTNVYGYGLLVSPSERADVIVDFSAYAGQTLILYNDAPAPFPFNDQRVDYFTGDGDQTGTGGAYSTLPGYGPNTRTIMQIKVSNANPAAHFSATTLLTALPAAYAASQPAPIVAETAYNTAFRTSDQDNYGRVATGSAAQPTLDFTTTGAITLTGINIVSSTGAGSGSGVGYLTPPLVNIVGGLSVTGTAATAHSLLNAVGQVGSVVIDSFGSGYTTPPTVTFTPVPAVSGITVVNGGSGYTAPVVTLDPPNLAGGIQATATATVLTTGSGIQPTVTIASGNGGSGYLTAPAVTFTSANGKGTGAAGLATISTSPLAKGTASVTLSNPGAGYTNPTVVVSAPQTPGTTATATAIAGYGVANITLAAPVGGGFDQPTTALPNPGNGTTVVDFSLSLPQLIGGQPPVATVTLDPNSGAVTAINFTSFGSGYTSAPTATIKDNFGTTATIPLSLDPTSGQIFGVNILTGGTGYTAPATLTFSGGNPTTAAAGTVALAGSAGSVTGVVITNTGTGYTAAPNVGFNGTAGAISATATVNLATAPGAITAITVTNPGSGYTNTPNVFIKDAAGVGAFARAATATAGTGAQATIASTRTQSIPVLTKAEQELFDSTGRYNSTGGSELPYTTAAIQTTVPLQYVDTPTEIIGENEAQIWKLVDNGFWSNSIHFDMNDVQLINRVGWDGTVKAPSTAEVGWKDTLRLNPLEDVIVAIRAHTPKVPFGQPQSTRLQDPSIAKGAAGISLAAGLPAPARFTADTNVVNIVAIPGVNSGATQTNPTLIPNLPLLTTATNTNIVNGSLSVLTSTPGTGNGNFDNEFIWGTAVLGHSENDFQRPLVFNPNVVAPSAPNPLTDTLGTGTLTWVDTTPVSPANLANPQNEINFVVLQAPITNLATYALGNWTPVATPFASVPANVTSFVEPAALVSSTPPNNQFYAYQVVAHNAAGDAKSNTWYEAPPLAPSNEQISSINSTSATTTSNVTATVTWNDNADNETNYIITRIGGLGATLSNGKVTGGSTTQLAPLAANSTSYPDNGLTEGAPYEYDIIARNSFGDSTPVLSAAFTAPISVPLAPTLTSITPTKATCPVDAVTNVTVPVRCKPDDVVLSWVDNAFNETSYVIERSGGSVQFTTVSLSGTLNNAGATMTYKDTTALEGVPYTYKISAVNTSVSGVTQSASASGNVTIAPTAPTLPTNLKVVPSTALDSNGLYVDTATVTWSDNAYNEDSYQVLRDGLPVGNAIVGAGSANNPSGTATAKWTASPVLTFTDTGVADGTTHIWNVQAINGVGTTASSTGFTAAMPGIIINPPTSLNSTPNRAGSSIGLSWVNQANNETDFLVEESVSTTGGSPGSFTNWTIPAGSPVTRTVAVGQTVNFNRANVPTAPGYVYTFRVSARNMANHSDSHPYVYAQSSLQAPVLTAAPTLAVPTVTANGLLGLSWTAVAAPAGTTISYVVSINGVKLPNTNQLTYNYRPTVAQLQAGITINVQAVATAIRVANPTAYGSTTGPMSNTQTYKAAAPAAPAVPTGLAATINGTTGAVTLNWTPVTPATGTTVSYLVSVNGAAGVPIGGGFGGGGAALALATGASYSVSMATVATALGLSTTSAYSAPITVDLTAAAVPSAPATLTVNATTLNWTAPATVSANSTVTYTVQQSVNGGAWTTLTATPITARNLAVASPVGTNYQYRVQAMATRYGLATSAPSAWTTTVYNTAPAASTTPVAALVSTRHISVTWTNVSSNITGFTIQRSLNGGGWTTIAPAPAVTKSGTTYSIADVVTAAGSYTYRLTATSVGGTSARTAASNAIVTP